MKQRSLAFWLLAIGSATYASAWADAAQLKSSRFADRLKPSNDWQFIPRTPKPRPPDISGARTRDARDRYADRLAPRIPLKDLQAKGIGTGGGISISTRDELLPDYPNEAVVMGYFRDFDMVLSASGRSIYTEIQIEVERVLCTATPVHSRDTITVLQVGGSVIANDGRALTYKLASSPFVIQPQHRYVIFLQYVADGDFYWLHKTIELRDGKVLPNSLSDIRRAEKGDWPYLDLNEEAAITRIAAALAERGQK